MKYGRETAVIFVRTTREAWRNVVLVNIFAMIASTALTFVIYPFELAYQMLFTTPLIAFLVAAPASLYFGTLMLRHLELTVKFKEMADRDLLTGLATRAFFFARMKDTPMREGTALMVDIDHFKSVNDRFGHLAGDTVIRHVAQRLAASARADDIVCRFGGEEFLIFLADYSAADALKAAERMRRTIAMDPISFEDTQIPVTISVGGAWKTSTEDVAKAIKDADAALYAAKKSGRNKVIFDVAGTDAPEKFRVLG